MFFFPFATITESNENNPEGFKFMKELRGIREYRLLSNDLTLLLRTDNTAPVVTFMVTYRVGSRNEAVGHTGATHLLEHMMFKGTPNFNREKGTQIAAELQKVGALLNATTWFDRTNYFEVLPSDQLELAIKIEADRMRNSMIRDEDRQSEMTVVRNEFDIGENRPDRVLHDRLFAHAYMAHPYHHSTIGWRSDIEGVSTERLREFYNTFYWPNNATVSIIGQFPEPEVFHLVKKYFGAISRSPHRIPEVYTAEPAQQGEVRFKLRRAGQLGIVAVAHKTPEALHPDSVALDLLSAVLSVGKTSRLYRAIIDKNLGISQYTHAYQLRDPSLIITQVTLTATAKYQQVEQLILQTYQEIQNQGISERELEIARNQLIADIAYDRDGTYAYASKLNEAIASANWEYYVSYIDKLQAVRIKEIQDVANKYFVKDNRVVGYFEPIVTQSVQDRLPEGGPAAGPAHYSGISAAPAGFAVSGNFSNQAKFADRIIKITSETGARCLMLPTGVEKVVSIRAALKAGEFFAPDTTNLVARLTADLLDHGTQKRDKFQLAEALEEIGAELSFNSGTFDLNVRSRFLKEHTERVFELIHEILREPAFPEEEFKKAKQQLSASLQKRMESTAARARNLLTRKIFSEEHPYWQENLDSLVQQVEKITLEDIWSFYRSTFGGQNLIMSVVGDIQQEAIENQFLQYFGEWEGGVEIPKVSRLQTGNAGEDQFFMNDKPNIDVYFGHVGIPRLSDQEYIPFLIANNILGDSPLSSRLGADIRDTQGLTYAIYSFISTSNLADGFWGIYMAVSPPDLQKALKAVFQLTKQYRDSGPTEKELGDAKRTVIGKFKVVNGLNSGALASQLLYVENEGLGDEYLDRFEERVQSVTLADVNQAIGEFMHPDNFVVAMAGGILNGGKAAE